MLKINMQKLSTAIKFIIPVSLALAIFLFVYLVVLITNVTVVREEGSELIELSNDVLHSNDRLIKLMRLYTFTRDETVMGEYEAMLDNLDSSFERLIESDNTESEIRQIEKIGELLDKLAEVEDRAFAAIDSGDYDAALDLVYGQEYINLDAEFLKEIKSLIENKKIRINEESARLTARGTVGLLSLALYVLITLAGAVLVINMFAKKFFWYENILDNIPFILSVIDNDMKIVFVNKTASDTLGRKRGELIGHRCDDVWKASCSACNTPNCGLERFKAGHTQTEYTADGSGYFNVTVATLKNKHGRQTGYMELDQDVTHMVAAQKSEAALVDGIRHSIYSFAAASGQITAAASKAAEDISAESSVINDIVSVTTKKGREQMEQMLKIMGEINDANKNIKSIIGMINDVARQINILALNASVEAVRAGEHGRSFAIVAEEVRNLATKSAEAVVNSENYIKISDEKIEVGSRIAGQMAENMGDITEGFNKTSGIVNGIAETNEQQAAAIQEIDANVKTLENLLGQFGSVGPKN